MNLCMFATELEATVSSFLQFIRYFSIFGILIDHLHFAASGLDGLGEISMQY